MKTMTVFEARNHFSRTLDQARDDVVIVTRSGRPVAAIQAIGDEDLEDFLLERSEKFWDMIARARSGRAVGLEAVKRELLGVPRPAPRRKRPGGRPARRGPATK